MTPESGNAKLGVGFGAMCAARLAMAGAATLTVWGVGEIIYGLASQPETYGNSPYTSTSELGYIADEHAAADHAWSGVHKVSAGATAFLGAWTADIVIMDRRTRKKN